MANPAPGFQDHPDHKLMLDTGPDAVTVQHGEALVAMTTSAVMLREDRYPVRAYVPRDDVQATLTKSEKTTRCPFKGEATYYHVEADGKRLENAAWSYDAPYDEVEAIKGHLAFDDRFEQTIG